MSRPELPPGVPAGGPPLRDPVADEARGQRMLDQTGAAIVAGVERCIPRWVEAQVARVLDLWGRADGAARAEAAQAAAAAGVAAGGRVTTALGDLLARDAADQRATPLEIVRTVYREPTAVLAAAGVPGVVRDPFDERSWPEDAYDLVPRVLGDLGDPDLSALQLAWGVAKSTVLRARAARAG